MDKIKRETDEAVQTEKKRADAATQAANHKQIDKDREAAERIEKQQKEKAESEAKEK